ncbi:PREDICTED: serine/arginine repetitive matrix protein 1-like [Cyprinodon variegatus]|uniref:serine/arginine repetitive matrix protein 1-like n=1 Tax=Cyprinodon variegatus TaxID=28743 RepID=UPI000742A2F4|nr:PREDICTED: serine/arginine repetitive matrix protein 1-like [Cyprinodon variegatus]
MPAAREAAGTSPRARPATLKTSKHAPAPSPCNRLQHPMRPRHPGKTHRWPRPQPGPTHIRREPASRNPPKTPPRPKARPHPTKTDAYSVQRNTPCTETTQEQKAARRLTAKRADRSRRNPNPPAQPSHTGCSKSSTTALPLQPPDARRAEPLRPPRSHTRCDQREQSTSTMPHSGKTHPKTQLAQPAHPHQPLNTGAAQTPTHQRRAASRTPTQRARPPPEKTGIRGPRGAQPPDRSPSKAPAGRGPRRGRQELASSQLGIHPQTRSSTSAQASPDASQRRESRTGEWAPLLVET